MFDHVERSENVDARIRKRQPGATPLFDFVGAEFGAREHERFLMIVNRYDTTKRSHFGGECPSAGTTISQQVGRFQRMAAVNPAPHDHPFADVKPMPIFYISQVCVLVRIHLEDKMRSTT